MKIGKLLELNFKEGEKVKISPVGDVIGVDGRTYKIDGLEVISKTKEANVDLVLDVNHGWSEERESAAGWFDINSLELRADGIYASLNNTEIGKDHIAKRFYRYLSPVYVMDRNRDDRTVLSIDSVGLVNRPNVLDKALNNKKQTKETDTVLTPEQIAQLQAENNKLKDENSSLTGTIEKLNKEVKEFNTKFIEQKVEMAVTAGELMPNKKDFAMGLAGEMLDTFLELNKKDAEHLKQETNQDAKKKDEDEDPKVSQREKEINAQLGIDENGEDI